MALQTLKNSDYWKKGAGYILFSFIESNLDDRTRCLHPNPGALVQTKNIPDNFWMSPTKVIDKHRKMT
jgi:hypothetical protein